MRQPKTLVWGKQWQLNLLFGSLLVNNLSQSPTSLAFKIVSGFTSTSQLDAPGTTRTLRERILTWEVVQRILRSSCRIFWLISNNRVNEGRRDYSCPTKLDFLTFKPSQFLFHSNSVEKPSSCLTRFHKSPQNNLN